MLSLLLIGMFFEEYGYVSATYSFVASSYGGAPIQGPWFIDVLVWDTRLNGELPNGELRSRLVGEDVLILKFRETDINGRRMDELTLRLTARQARSLEQAQKDFGDLRYLLCVPDRPLRQKIREFGPRRITEGPLELLGDDGPRTPGELRPQ